MKVGKEARTALIKSMKAKRIEVVEFDWLWHAIERFPQQPVESAVRNAILNLRHMKNLERNPMQVGPFAIVFSRLYAHKESVISAEVLDSKRDKIATVGFFLQVRPKGRKLYISNIQGIKRADPSLAKLSKQVGENWRVWTAKQLKDFATQHKFETVGMLPGRGLFLSSPKEYKRQVRQYMQTFKKAGITEIDRSQVWKPTKADKKQDLLVWGWKKKRKKQKRRPL